VYFEIVPTVWCPTVWYILELFRKWDIFWNCFDSGIFWNCSESGIYFETVPTVCCILKKYTTLSEKFQNTPHHRNSFKIYHTVGTVSKYTTLWEVFQDIPHCRNSFKIYHTVGTVPKYTTLSEQFILPTVWYILELFQQCGIFWNCSESGIYFETVPRCQNSFKIYHPVGSFKIYHTVGSVPRYTTLSEQFQNIPHCRNSTKIYQTVGKVSKYTILSEKFQGVFWNYSESVVSDRLIYFGTVPKVGYILKLFRQCVAFWNFSDHTVETVSKYTTQSEKFQNTPHSRNSFKIYHTVGTDRNITHCRNSSNLYHTVEKVSKYTTLSEQFTVWCILKLFRQCGVFWNFPDNVVYFELFQQCCIFWNCSNSMVYFEIVPTVWCILKLSRQCGIY
jgi:hypothetical protein